MKISIIIYLFYFTFVQARVHNYNDRYMNLINAKTLIDDYEDLIAAIDKCSATATTFISSTNTFQTDFVPIKAKMISLFDYLKENSVIDETYHGTCTAKVNEMETNITTTVDALELEIGKLEPIFTSIKANADDPVKLETERTNLLNELNKIQSDFEGIEANIFNYFLEIDQLILNAINTEGVAQDVKNEANKRRHDIKESFFPIWDPLRKNMELLQTDGHGTLAALDKYLLNFS